MNITTAVTNHNKIPLRSMLAYTLIFLMIGASVLLHNREMILPEVAALAVAGLIYRNPGWLSRPFHIFLLPSLTATGGFLINNAEFPLAAKLILAVAFVLLTLLLFKSTLAPALATGLLPVITNITSVHFIYAIATFTALLAASMYAKPGASGMHSVSKRRHQDHILYFGWISAWILICAQNGWMHMAAMPPVLVVGFESVHKEDYQFAVFYKQALCLFLTAFTGVLSLYYLHNLLLSAVIDLIAVTFLLRLVKFKFPPAYAMALLPMVLPGASPKYFYWQVLVMAAVVLGGIYSYKNLRLNRQFKLVFARVNGRRKQG